MTRKILFYLFVFSFFNLIYADPPNWDSDGDGVLDNYNEFQNSGSITSAVFIDGNNLGSPGDLIGFFIEDELRGVGVSSSVPFGPYAGTYQFLTLIYSNESSGETITIQF